MVNPIQLPVLLSQLPQIQKVQHAQQSHPEAYQALAAKEVAEEQKRAQNQVPKAEQSEMSLKVGPDTNREQGGSAGKRNQGGQEAGDEPMDDAEAGPSGRIIDLKV